MSNEEILNTDIIRARIADKEYGKISAEEIIRIYIEETGHEPPGEITIYHSDEIKNLMRMEKILVLMEQLFIFMILRKE